MRGLFTAEKRGLFARNIQTTTNAEINVASNKELAVFILNNY